MSFIQADNLTKSFGLVKALDHVSMHISVGEIVSILGESGSGKTTLLRCIAGFEVPDAGSITLADSVLVAPGKFIPPEKRGIGIVFQDHALFPHLSVERNIKFGLQNLEKSKRKDRVEELLQRIQLEGFNKRMPHELSGGQKQRVAIARAIAPKPKLLLLDEPFSSLDANLRSELRAQFKMMIDAEGITAMMVSHDIADAKAMSNAMGWMSEGKMIQFGSYQEILENPASKAIEAAFQ